MAKFLTSPKPNDYHPLSWDLQVDQDFEQIPCTCESIVDDWSTTCECGRRLTKASLVRVVDATEWELDICECCGGSDPHEVVTASHLQCFRCGRTIEPKRYRAYHHHTFLRSRSAQLKLQAVLGDALYAIEYLPTEEDIERLRRTHQDDRGEVALDIVGWFEEPFRLPATDRLVSVEVGYLPGAK